MALVSVVAASALRIILVIYVVAPFGIVLIFREPEVSSTLYNHPIALVCGLLATIVAWKRQGLFGFLPVFGICLAILLYNMDEGGLWKPPIDVDLSGKVALVTGANAGIGKATTIALATMGAQVVATCRTLTRCNDVVMEANTAGKHSGGSAQAVVLDLDSLESASRLVTQLTQDYPTIHYVFANAGSTPTAKLTREGLEPGFGGMHLAHMALILGLLPSLRRGGEESTSTPSRIIMVASDAALLAATGMLGPNIPFDDTTFMTGKGEGDLRGEQTRGDGATLPSLRAYARAKLCNCLFAFELNRHFQAQKWPIVVNALHTGSVYTKTSAQGIASLFAWLPGVPFLVSRVYLPLLWRTPQVASRVLLFAALDDSSSIASGGEYIDALCHASYNDDWPKLEALRQADVKYAARLWNVSLSLLLTSPARSVVEMVP